MVNSIIIDRRTGNGKYADVLDALAILGGGIYGSATNAAATLIRQHPDFPPALVAAQRNHNPKSGGDQGEIGTEANHGLRTGT